MSRFTCVAAVLVLAAGCHTAQSGNSRRMKMGPPPPGYIKIRGEAVPGWEPWHMLAAPRGAGGTVSWFPLGPRPILDEYWSGSDDATGRVVSIAVHPVDPDIVYIASASGGIWKTADGGGVWVPLTDELSNLNHGCVAIDPSSPETVYAGTGEYTTQSSGDGLFRSTDGGTTWQRIGTVAQVGSTCSRVVVDPADSQRIHVTGNIGYVRTVDGGASWIVEMAGAASDVAVNPDNPSVVCVARHGNGVWRSTDGGDTFIKFTLAANGIPGGSQSRVLLAMAPSNPNTLYAAILQSNGRDLRGLYKTTNGGDNWTQLVNTPNFPSPQGWYDMFLGVDPVDENTVYAGGVFPSFAVAGVIKSTDGGNNWSDITVSPFSGQLHPDQHAIAFGPDGTIWVGNDGGVWKSADGGTSWINTNATLTVTQNYNIALHPSDAAQVLGGTQDNGTVERELDIEEWPQLISGDGGFAAYDFVDPTRRYTTYVYLTVFRFSNTGAADITGPWDGVDPVNFIAPLIMDPNDSHTLLGGTNRVWRTTDAHAAANWVAISDATVAGSGRLNALAVATGASDTIYTGSSSGALYVTTDAVTWNNRSGGLPVGQISDIVIDPEDPATAYVAFYNTSGPRVLRTENHGQDWTSMTGDLPAGVSARALAVDWRINPPDLYVGTGVGVYSSWNGGINWTKDGTDLPNVNIGDLAIDAVLETITVGTYGRGAWRAVLPPAPVPGDCNRDGGVDLNDFATFASCFGLSVPSDSCDSAELACNDLDGNGVVDLTDFATFALNFGG